MEQIRLNLIPTGPMPVCHASQYDKKREIGLVLFNGTRPLLLTDETLELDVRKSDSHIVTIDVPTPEGTNLAVFETTEQMCAVAGSNECELRIKKAGSDIGTLNFIMEIERSPMENGLQSDSEIRNLATQIAAAATPVVEQIAPPIIRDFLADDYYNKEATDEAIATATEGKADTTYVDTELDKKADKNNTYTKTEVDEKIDELPEPMIFKGTLGVGGTIQTLPTASASNEGWTFKCITAGTYAGLTLKVGDTVTCFNPPNTSNYYWDKTGSQDTDTDTWRNIKVNGVEKLGNGISSGAVDFVGSENIEVEFDANGNKVGIKTKNIYTKEEVDDIVYNILPDDTASGSVANFETDLALPIKSLEVDVNAKQDLHGYDNPWTAGGGKNLLKTSGLSLVPPSSTIFSNLTKRTFSPNSFCLGLTSNNYYQSNKVTQYLVEENNISVTSSANAYAVMIPITNLNIGETYTLSASSSQGKMSVGFWEEDGTFISNTQEVTSGVLSFSVPQNAYYVGLSFNPRTNDVQATFTNIQLEKGSTATDYAPYENICPIEGWSEITPDVNGNTEVINLGGTYYGGHFTQDKAGHRQFEVTHALTTVSEMNNNRSWYYSTSNGFWINEGLANTIVKTASGSEVTTAISDYFETVSRNNLKNADDRLCVNTSGYVCIYGSELPTTKNEFLSSVGNAKLVYPLATPYTIDLPDGEPIITLNGTNNIYADSGDTSVVFKNSVNGYVEKKIASVQALILNT